MLANKALVPDERRMETRYDCEAKIKWSYFIKGGSFDAKTLNCSPNGIYFETPNEVKSGTTILIRIDSFSSKNIRSDEPNCLRSVSLAEVKWCRESSNGGDRYFGAGVRQLDLK